MSTTKWIAISVLAGAGIVAALSWNAKPDGEAIAPATPASQGGVITAQVPMPQGEATTPQPPSFAARASSAPASPLDAVAPPLCRTTERGDLVIDPQTREEVELVAALYTPEKAIAKLAEACADRPPKAAQEMKNLYRQFVQYSQSIRQTFPPDEQVAIPVEKLEEVLLKGMHDLRVQYFGAERACAMYCEEEELTRRMLALAIDYKQRNPKATTEEAVGHAQGEITRQAAAQQTESQGGVKAR